MSKKKARQRQKPDRPKLASRRRRKSLIIVGLVLSLALTTLIIAQWRSIRSSFSTLSPAPQTSPSPPVSKEYIYANGKLVAIEEPTTGDGSGPAPTNLNALATSGTTVSLTWTAPTGAINAYQVERSPSINGPFTPLTPNPTTTSFTDSTAESGKAYLYQVKALYVGGGSSNYSNKDLATTVVFTDNPLAVGVTPIMARHLTELRAAVNAVRLLTGIGTASWTYPDPVSTPVEQRRKIYLEDVTDLRARLDEALTILGTHQPYETDPPLARGNLVRAAHFMQIRERVK